MAKTKVSRNDPCLCLSGLKYKKCCEGKVPWPEILKSRRTDPLTHLSARGKNLYFLAAIAKALQLDKIDSKTTWADIKRAVTPDAVRFIHEAVVDIWPDQTDLERVLLQEKESTNGLYVGGYEPEFILRGITRHCLYSDSIILLKGDVDSESNLM